MNDLLLYVGPDKRNEELRYALRTWEKNLKFRKLCVVGGPIPKWFKPNIYIPNPLKYTKMLQCYDDLVIALQDDRLADDVVIMMDDIFLLKNFGEWRINYNRGTLSSQIERTGGVENAYNELVNNTLVELQKEFDAPLSFEEHLPFVCNRKKMLGILREYGAEKMPNLLYRSIYGNRFKVPTELKYDCKIRDMHTHIPPNADAFSTNALSFRGNAGSFAKFHFQKPSRFEKII